MRLNTPRVIPREACPGPSGSSPNRQNAALMGGAPLTVVFTVRGTRVRVISARPMSQAERRIYDQAAAHPQADP
jgi:hypothetical protein